MVADVDFRPVPSDEGDGAVLVGAMVDEMRELYWDIGGGLDLNSPDMRTYVVPSVRRGASRGRCSMRWRTLHADWVTRMARLDTGPRQQHAQRFFGAKRLGDWVRRAGAKRLGD